MNLVSSYISKQRFLFFAYIALALSTISAQAASTLTLSWQEKYYAGSGEGFVKFIDPARNNRCVATINFVPDEARPHIFPPLPKKTERAYVGNFIVLPEYRHAGIGTTLFFKELPKILRQIGYTSMHWQAGPYEVDPNCPDLAYSKDYEQKLSEQQYQQAFHKLIKFYQNGGGIPNKDAAGNYIFDVEPQSGRNRLKFTYVLTASTATQPGKSINPTTNKPNIKKTQIKARSNFKKRTRKAAAAKAVKNRKSSSTKKHVKVQRKRSNKHTNRKTIRRKK